MNEGVNDFSAAAWSLFILVASPQHHLLSGSGRSWEAITSCTDIVIDSSKALSSSIYQWTYKREANPHFPEEKNVTDFFCKRAGKSFSAQKDGSDFPELGFEQN